MDRIQKKCFIASAGFHLLLVVILFIGPAFLSAPKKADIPQEITFYNVDILTANGPTGGGHPAPAQPIKTPPSTLPPPPPERKKADPETAKDPERQKETKTARTKVDPNSYESKKPKLSAADLKAVTRSKSSTKIQNKSKSTTSDDQERKDAESRRELARMFQSAASGLSSSTATKIEDHIGPGGGGPVYASYAAWVQKMYLEAWAAPNDASSESAVLDVVVTIRNDGTVISTKIIKYSGDSAVDGSVQRALNRLTSMDRPFPEGMNERQHTYTITFDLKAKKGLA